MELSFHPFSLSGASPDDWESVMWALHAAAVQMMQIPSGELGCTCYGSSVGSTSILFYDDVPGGAGHTQQLAPAIVAMLRKAYEIVATCSCGEETCCYGCIANYYNQSRQHLLSRGAAKRILGSLLYPDGHGVRDVSSSPDDDGDTSAEMLHLEADFSGADLGGLGFGDSCLFAARRCGDGHAGGFLRELASLGRGIGLETPQLDVTFSNSSEEADALLAWKRARVALVDADGLADFEEAFGASPLGGIDGWTFFNIEDTDPHDIIRRLAD